MELIFENKLTEKQILDKAKTYGKLSINTLDDNIFIFGDNFEGMAKLYNTFGSCIDLVYIDPPFNTKQTFSISKGRCSSISRAKNGLVAYSDEFTKIEFLEFLRERIVMIKNLLTERGSLYLHIDCKIGHYIKVILDEIFGEENYRNDITRIKSNPKNFSRKAYGNEKDVIYFYCKNAKKQIWNEVKEQANDAEIERLFPKIDEDGRRYTTIPLHAPGETNGVTGSEWRGMLPPQGRHWRTDPAKFDEMDQIGLIEWSKNGNPRIKKFADEHSGKKIQDIWEFKDPQYPQYPTEKNLDMLLRVVDESSLGDSIVMDCFAGSGTTLHAANIRNRKWIGMDSSKIALGTILNRKGELGDFILI
ncbi:MAG: site-specific DNA-methyltransferase [Candidatus Enteromonas sp.]|nr:site-specific DNA-methyltransferase [Candidatus Enteromonas sp.]